MQKKVCSIVMASVFAASPAFAANATQPAVNPPLSAESAQGNASVAESSAAPGTNATLSAFTPRQPEFQEDSTFNFRKARWGMSPAEVEAAISSRPTRHDTNRKTGVYRIGYKDVNLFGVAIWEVYSFIDDKLWGAGYAKDYAKEGEFETIAARALAYYGETVPLKKDNTTEYRWLEGTTQIVLRLVDDPRRGLRIFFNFTSDEFSPEL